LRLIENPQDRHFALAGLCTIAFPTFYALVAFDIFDWLRSIGVPVWLQAVIATSILVAFALKKLLHWISHPRDKLWKIGAVFLILLAIVVVDYRFPAKFIHVPQYLILGYLVSYFLRPYLDIATGLTLVLVLLLCAAVTDESIQGYMASRSYGVRDIGTDIFAGVAATIFVFRETPPDNKASSRSDTWTVMALCIAALVFTAYALHRYAALDEFPEFWIFAPLLFAGAASFLVAAFDFASHTEPYGLAWQSTAASARVLGLSTIILVGLHGIAPELSLNFR